MLSIIQEPAAQGYDRFWISGYDYWNTIPNNPNFGGTYIDFNEEPPHVYYDPNHTMNFWGTGSTISNAQGELLFYSNGMTIHDALHNVVDGGDTIGYGPYWEELMVNGMIGGAHFIQGAFFLPDPSGDEDEYWLCYAKADLKDTIFPEMSDILLARIQKISGNWEVVSKDELILHDTLANGELAICRHANGRDWWMLIGEKNTNAYYRLLVDPAGIHVIEKQLIGSDVNIGVGQAGFADIGNIYYRFEGSWFGDDGGKLHIYDFDRCSGRLSNHRSWVHPFHSLCGAIAPLNGRYLYTTDALNLYQWDLKASDIHDSKIVVATYDGFTDENGFETYFSFMMEGPDGRLYIIPPSGGSKFMHTIEYPYLSGTACSVIQHKIKLPTWNQRTVTMLPNFRLGALDGSFCDTLGIDNVPVAHFRFVKDSVNRNSFDFIDLSYFDPQSWLWDFGDGNSSSDQYPQHDYEAPGLYEVCLTVYNPSGSNTNCQEVVADKTTGIADLPSFNISLFPNPFNDFIQFDPPSSDLFKIVIYNASGSEVVNVEMSCPCTILTTAFTPGMYTYRISSSSFKSEGHLVKIK